MTQITQRSTSRETRKRRNLSRKLSTCKKLIKGSLVVNRRRCGKAGCRCSRGQLHKSLAFTYKKDGKSFLLHIPKDLETEARQAHKDYQKLKRLLEQISQLNIEILKGKAKSQKLRKS